ncbi:hypothetical protein [Rhodohalobacter barkolensis]|uniref:Uncharacterized protein n=1 Tax=Rhodohalobacter barkolensis TaxID=2053187 RepID=A0A2N0VGI3_9BACT|nr:hypothetical protein [Rhodohalobacter barkolensis]PKD43312.1 hypothetical protein CWD77_11920 [Rhodohalobacter barkolensis]
MTEEDKLFKELLSHGEENLPFPDIEDDVMLNIERLELEKKAIQEDYQRGVAFSWFFFIVGIVSGIVLMSLIPQMEFQVSPKYTDTILLVFQVGFILFVLTHFEKLMSMTRKNIMKF